MTRVKIVVVGGGSWGTGFSCLLRDRGHDVTLACRDPERVRVVNETGRNPKYLTKADLRGVRAATIDEAPLAEAEVIVLAVPSVAFAAVAAALPGKARWLFLRRGPAPPTATRLPRR